MREDVFAYRAVAAGLRLPKIHMIINNRVTIYNFRSVELRGFPQSIIFLHQSIEDV